MLVAHKIRIYPNAKQEVGLRKACGAARWAWNWALNEWQKSYENKEKVNEGLLRKKLNSIKKEQFPWLLESTKSSPQQAIINLGKAYQSYFKSLKTNKKVGRPKFKSKKKNKDSFYIDNVNPLIKEKNFRVPKIDGTIKMAESLRYSGKIMSYTISRDVDRWYVSVLVDTSDIQKLEPTGKTVGVDLGIKTLATLSDGTVIENPKYLKQQEKRLARQQRIFARRQKESKSKEKAKVKLQKLHRKVKLSRLDTIHQVTTKLVRNYECIVIEDLNVKGMVKNRSLAKAISDVGFGMFRTILTQKCEMYGRKLITANRFFPSSKTCSNCGCIKDELSLKERVYHCNDCGFEIDRDLNAAINLKNTGLLPGIEACRLDVKPEAIQVVEVEAGNVVNVSY
jgi:putative transposase